MGCRRQQIKYAFWKAGGRRRILKNVGFHTFYSVHHTSFAFGQLLPNDVAGTPPSMFKTQQVPQKFQKKSHKSLQIPTPDKSRQQHPLGTHLWGCQFLKCQKFITLNWIFNNLWVRVRYQMQLAGCLDAPAMCGGWRSGWKNYKKRSCFWQIFRNVEFKFMKQYFFWTPTSLMNTEEQAKKAIWKDFFQ